MSWKIVFASILIAFAAILVQPPTTYALVDSMTYQGTVTINNTGNASTLTDYQISVTIDTSALISAGRMQSDCDDIRFVDSDNSTKLSYWFESGCNTTTTKFWVKVPSIGGSATKTIYTHFGNNSATSESNGSNTFIFFDDFNSLNSSVWTVTDAPSATISAGVLNVSKGTVYSKTTLATQSGTLAESKIAWTGTGTYGAHAGFQIGDSTNTASSNGTSKRVAYFFSPDGGAVASAGTGILAGSGYNIVASTQLKNPTNGLGYTFTAYVPVVAGIAFSDTKLYYFINYGYYANNSYTVPTANGSNWMAPYYIWLGHFSGSNGGTTDGSDVKVDWVRVRKFLVPSAEIAGNEPTITANVGITPSQTRNLVAAGGNQKVLLTWDAPTSGSGITDYVVQYSSDGSNFSTFADGTSTSTTATVTGLTNGTTYTFKVYAVNGSGDGIVSSTAQAIPTNTTLHGFLLTGQSQSIGYNGYPALTTTQPYFNLKLNSDNSKLATLIEDRDVGDDYTGANESPMSAIANTLTELVGGGTYQSVFFANGVGGYAYDLMKYNTAPYANGLTYITTGKNIADSLGRDFKIEAVINIHGPADRDHPELYEGFLNSWQNDYESSISAITNQTGSIPMFIDQASNLASYGKTSSEFPVAQLSAAENNADIYMVMPKYFLYYGPDWIHPTNQSYRLIGDYYGKALKKVLVDGDPNIALIPAEQVRKDNVITVRFNVPVAPLVFDTTNVLSKTNYGFEFYDNSGSTPAISNVSLLGQDSVRITLASTPTGGTQKIRYAWSSTAFTPTGAQESGGARGNLRDSDTTEGSANTPLYNWAVHFDKNVTADSTAPSRSDLAVTTATTSASVTWSTNENTTETFKYGLTTSYGNTATISAYPRAMSHSKNISALTGCTSYHYQIISTDLAGNINTSSDSSFTTNGCTGASDVVSQTQNTVTTASGGTVSLTESGAGLGLTIPPNFANSDATFQIKRLEKASVIVAAPTPSGYVSLGDYYYDLKALENENSTISSFDESVTVTLTYSDGDITGYDESQLKILRWNGSSWSLLSGCTVNTTSNTVTCSTTGFSVFSLFAPAAAALSSPTPTPTPTPIPSSGSNTSSSASGGTSASSTETGCQQQKPATAPMLFQVDRTLTAAKLFVTPGSKPYDKFVVLYGPATNPEQYAATFAEQGFGVQSFVIGDLAAKVNYSFKVQAMNGCNGGDWSNTILVAKGTKHKKSYYPTIGTQISTQVRTAAFPVSKKSKVTTKSQALPTASPAVVTQPQMTATPAPAKMESPQNTSKKSFLDRVKSRLGW